MRYLRCARPEIIFPGPSSPRVTLPYRVLLGVPLQPSTLAAPALVRFFPLRRLTVIRSPLTLGLPRPVRCASRFSQPPSAFLLQTPPSTVSAGNAHGVHPSEHCSLQPAGASSRGPLPSCRWHVDSDARLQGLQPIADPLLLRAGLELRGARCSPGFSPLRGIHPLHTRAFPDPFLSQACHEAARCAVP